MKAIAQIWPKQWKSLAPYAPGVRVGDLIFVSGQVPVDPESGISIEGDITAQTRQVLNNIEGVLSTVEAGRGNIVKTTIFLTLIHDFDEMNNVYREFFGQHLPARSTVGVSALGRPEFRIEIDAIAAL